MKTIFTVTFAIGLIFVAQSCTDSSGKGAPIPKTTDPIPVRIQPLQKTSAEPVIATSGRISTDDETTLSFKVGGVVKSVFVKEGDYVKKGQLLATLDLTEINAQVSQAKSGFDKAERDFTRIQNLYRDSVATLEQLQNAQTAFDVANRQLESAEFNRNFARINAVATGYVLRKFVNPGQVVGTGDPIVRTNGAGSGSWIVKAGVSDRQWAAIRINDRATLKLDAFPGEEFEGVVLRKSETSDPATGAFTIELSVRNPSKKLATGMFASVKIYSGDASASWNIPYEAVLDANGNEGFVFVTNDNKTALRQPVVIESFDGQFIRVNQGLESSNALIVSGSAYLTDKSPIKVVK